MDVVGHQAIGPDLGTRPMGGPGQEIAIEEVVAVLEEGLLAAIAALRHMVRIAGQHEAGETSHDAGVARAAP